MSTMDHVDLEEVMRLVRNAGVGAELLSTGGGFWAIYAGPRDANGRSAIVADGGFREDGRYVGYLNQLCVKPDDDFSCAPYVGTIGKRTAHDVATLIVEKVCEVGPKLNGRLVVTLAARCPRCQEAGRTTIGGYTPFLSVLPDFERRDDEPDLPFCSSHGYIAEDVSRVPIHGCTNTDVHARHEGSGEPGWWCPGVS